MIKYQIKEGEIELLFHVSEKGSLVIEANNEIIEVPHVVAVELMNILHNKLFEHQAKTRSILKNLFS